jgi:hypothetical protein
MVEAAEVAVAGVVIGLVAALTADMVLVLIAALWDRRPRAVAVAAIGGAAVADVALVAFGGWVGWRIVPVVADPDARATIAIGLFVGVASNSALGLLIGMWGVPVDAELPSRPLPTLARFALIELLAPTATLIAAGSVIAWPRTWAFGGAWPFVAGIVAGAAAARLGWAATERNRRGVRSTRTVRRGVRVAAILLLAALSIGAMPR